MSITTFTVNVLTESTERRKPIIARAQGAAVHLRLMAWASQVAAKRSYSVEGSVAARALVSVSIPAFLWRRVLVTVRFDQLI